MAKEGKFDLEREAWHRECKKEEDDIIIIIGRVNQLGKTSPQLKFVENPSFFEHCWKKN